MPIPTNTNMKNRTRASTRPRASKPKEHPQAPSAIQEHSLFTLFGMDIEAYVMHHMDEYEAEKARWAGCGMEEWVKGADGEALMLCYLERMKLGEKKND
jgi:hypothetical protein